MEVTKGSSSATWGEIQKAALDNGIDLFPAGYTLEKLDNRTVFDNNTPLTSGGDINIVFEKDITYKVDAGLGADKEAKFTVQYPDNGVTLEDLLKKIYTDNESDINAKIAQNYPTADRNLGAFENGKSFKAAAGSSVVFDGWKVITPDGKTKIVKPSEIATAGKFPAGTKVEPNWFTPPSIRLTNDVSIDFTFFEGGTLGTTPIGDFYIANTEITRAQWEAVMKTLNGGTWRQKAGDNQMNAAKSTADPTNMNLPMNKISWYDAIMFCNQLSKLKGRTPYYTLKLDGDNTIYTGDDFFTKLDAAYDVSGRDDKKGANDTHVQQWAKITIIENEDKDKPGFRLPTSDYWRYAAHGGKSNIYPTYSGTTGSSDADLQKVAWYGTTGGQPHEVGQKGGDNPVRDMSGNVSEWCWDEYAYSTRLYIGGTYNSGKESQQIDAVLTPGGNGILNAMFQSADPSASDIHKQFAAGSTGNRDSQGMRIIIPKLPS